MKKIEHCEVLLTNGWDRISYNILRSLANKGINVGFGVDKNSGIGRFSRLEHYNFVHPSYLDEEEKFIEFIVHHTVNCEIYIPTGEEIFSVAKNINRFNTDHLKIPISSYETLMNLHSKKESHRLAKSLGIPVPETMVPANEDDIRYFARQFGEPVVIKKILSSSSKGTRYLTRKDLGGHLGEYLYRNGFKYNDFILQQYVKGDGYGVSILMQGGELKARFTHKRLRELQFGGGPSTIRVSTKNELLESYAESLLRSVGFTGVAMIEFKYDEAAGAGHFLEVNPRFWGSLGLAINSGVDFPYLLYRMAKGEDFSPVLDYKMDFKFKWLLGDSIALFKLILTTRKISLFKSYLEKVDGFDDYYKDDVVPFLVSIPLYIKRNLRQYIAG